MVCGPRKREMFERFTSVRRNVFFRFRRRKLKSKYVPTKWFSKITFGVWNFRLSLERSVRLSLGNTGDYFFVELPERVQNEWFRYFSGFVIGVRLIVSIRTQNSKFSANNRTVTVFAVKRSPFFCAISVEMTSSATRNVNDRFHGRSPFIGHRYIFLTRKRFFFPTSVANAI